MGGWGQDTSKAYSRVLCFYTSTYLWQFYLMEDKAPQTFTQKPKERKGLTSLYFQLGSLVDRGLRETGLVTLPPLGGDSVVFVSLARCQRGSGSNGDLVGRGPGGVPDSPRSALRSPRRTAGLVGRGWWHARLFALRSPRRTAGLVGRGWWRARLFALRSPRRTANDLLARQRSPRPPTISSPANDLLARQRSPRPPTISLPANDLISRRPNTPFYSPRGEAAVGFATRSRRFPLSPLNLHPRLAPPLSPLIGQFPSRQRPF